LLQDFIVYYILKREFIRNIFTIGLKDRIEKIFDYLQIGSSGFAALNVGAIDVAASKGGDLLCFCFWI
jgi:PiT family inorganic phosphate transporter